MPHSLPFQFLAILNVSLDSLMLLQLVGHKGNWTNVTTLSRITNCHYITMILWTTPQGALSFQFPSLSLSLHDRATISLSTRTWLPFSLHILHPLTRTSVSTIGIRVWGGWLYLPLTSWYRMIFLEIGYVYFSFQLSLQFKTKFLLYNSKFNSI